MKIQAIDFLINTYLNKSYCNSNFSAKQKCVHNRHCEFIRWIVELIIICFLVRTGIN
jgi:hypothetical protein